MYGLLLWWCFFVNIVIIDIIIINIVGVIGVIIISSIGIIDRIIINGNNISNGVSGVFFQFWMLRLWKWDFFKAWNNIIKSLCLGYFI